MDLPAAMNPKMITIRRARVADLPLLARMEREFDRDQREIVLKENPRLKLYLKRVPGKDKITSKRIRKWVRSKNAIVLIAELDARPAGFSTVSIEKNWPKLLPRRYGFIGYMFVRRQYRGQKISSLMMEKALAWLATRQMKHVALTVIGDNKPARAIWAKWGFHDYVVFAWKLK